MTDFNEYLNSSYNPPTRFSLDLANNSNGFSVSDPIIEDISRFFNPSPEEDSEQQQEQKDGEENDDELDPTNFKSFDENLLLDYDQLDLTSLLTSDDFVLDPNTNTSNSNSTTTNTNTTKTHQEQGTLQKEVHKLKQIVEQQRHVIENITLQRKRQKYISEISPLKTFFTVYENAFNQIGAYICGKFEHAKQFIERSRDSFKEIFDDLPNFESAYGALGLLVYHFYTKGISERLPYETLMLQNYENIDDFNMKAHKNDFLELKGLVLIMRSFFPNDTYKEINIFNELMKLDFPTCKIYAACIFAEQVIINGANYKIVNQALQQLQQAQSILQKEQKKFHNNKYIFLLSNCKALDSALNLSLGNKQQAISLANESIRLFTQQVEFQEGYSLWWQYKLIEWPAKVHYITRCEKMLELDIIILQQLSTSHLFDQNGMQLLEIMKTRHFLLKQNSQGSAISSPLQRPLSPTSSLSASTLANPAGGPLVSTLNNPS